MSLVSRVLRSKPSVRALARCAEVTRTVSVKSGKKPDPYSKHKRLLGLYDIYPHVGEMTYVAHNATLTGEVYTADNVTIWDRAVIRGDLNAVRIHHNAVIREGVSISTVSSLPIGLPSIVSIGPFSIIQQGCSLVSCTIGSQCLIGEKSVILEGAKIEDESVIGPNSVVPPGRYIPGHELWAGNPVKFIRHLTKKEIWSIRVMASTTYDAGMDYQLAELTNGTAYLQKENTEDENPARYNANGVSQKHEEVDGLSGMYK